MKEIKYILGKKQADESIIYIKGFSGEETEKAFNYYDALDYKSLAYARATRNVYESLKDFDVYRVNIEIYNTELTREEERQKKIEEENKAELPEVVSEETEKAEEPVNEVEDTKEVEVVPEESKEVANEEKPVEETKEEMVEKEIEEDINKSTEIKGN